MLEHLQHRKVRVGVLDFGDGRDYLQGPLEPINRQFRQQLVDRLEAGGFDVMAGDEVIWQNDIAVRSGRRIRNFRQSSAIGMFDRRSVIIYQIDYAL